MVVKKNNILAAFRWVFFYTKLALNTATQSREALEEQTNIWRQGFIA